MESIQIGSNQIFSVFSHSHYNSEMGRLTQNSVVYSGQYSWDTMHLGATDGSKWVRIYLGITHEVHGIILRGMSYVSHRWVTTISLSYSMDDVTFTTHTIPGTDAKKVRLKLQFIFFLELLKS